MDSSFILHKGLVTHVIDPSSFWMRMGTDAHFEEFEEYQNTLEKFYNETGRKDAVSINTLSLGDCVIVADTGQVGTTVVYDDENNTDFHWKRAKVLRVDGDKVDVFYVDLGCTEMLDMSNVKNINRELFDYIPPQVVQLGLAGIRPLTRSWTSRAVAMFESKVLNQEVLVSLVEYDEVNKYGQVVIYLRHDDCTWHSLTHEMLKEEFGMSVMPESKEFLSQEEVLEALARGEQEQESSMHSLENNSDEDNDEATDTGSHKQGSSPETEQFISAQTPSNHLLFPSDFMLPNQSGSISKESQDSAVKVPACDLSRLKSTRYLSLSQMQEDKDKELRQQTRARLEKEVQDCEEIEAENLPEFDWGKTDLQIGKIADFADFDSSIRQEIYKNRSHLSSDTDLDDFFQEAARNFKDGTPAEPSDFPKQIPSNHSGRENTELKPLTEIEDYKIQKDIEEILLGKDSGELELVCVLINSVIEPDIDVPCDRLVATFTAILETLIRNSNVDQQIAFGALETYVETKNFEEAIDATLKSLRRSFIKLPHSIRSSDCHHLFAEVLAVLFIRSESWPTRACSKVQTFVITSLEHWTVFNKQRAQQGCVMLECLYLECVESITGSTWVALNKRFPERCYSLTEEMKHKLLHDNTERDVRVQLLNILLKLQTNIPTSAHAKPSGRDVSVQTDIQDTSNIRASLVSCEGDAFSDTNLDNDKTFERLPIDTVYSGDDLHTHDLDGNIGASDMHLLGSLLGQHTTDYYSYKSSVSLSLDTGASNISLNAKMGDHKNIESQSIQKGLQNKPKKYSHDNSFSEGFFTEKDRSEESLQRPVSCLLNVLAPEFKSKSMPVATAEQTNMHTDALKPELSGRSMQLQVDKESTISRMESDEEDMLSIETSSSDEEDSLKDDVGGHSNEMNVSISSSPTELEKAILGLDLEPIVHAVNSPENEKPCNDNYTSQESIALKTYIPSSITALNAFNEHSVTGCVVKNAENLSKADNYEAVDLRGFSSIPHHRYSGRGGSPIEVSDKPKSNSAKWKSLSELLPASFKSTFTTFGSSVDPEHSHSEVINDDHQIESINTKQSSLKDIAKGLFSTSEFVPENGRRSPAEINTILREESVEHAAVEEIVQCDGADLSVISDTNDDQGTYKRVWPESFFISAQPVCDDIQSTKSNTTKNRKKKMKFRPISEVLAEQTSAPNDSDYTNQSGINCYEDLEIQNQEVGGQVIHQPRLGALAGKSGNRSSQLFDLRQDRPKADPWKPGRRKCTRCGSEDHTIYDCSEEDPIGKMDL